MNKLPSPDDLKRKLAAIPLGSVLVDEHGKPCAFVAPWNPTRVMEVGWTPKAARKFWAQFRDACLAEHRGGGDD